MALDIARKNSSVDIVELLGNVCCSRALTTCCCFCRHLCLHLSAAVCSVEEVLQKNVKCSAYNISHKSNNDCIHCNSILVCYLVEFIDNKSTVVALRIIASDSVDPYEVRKVSVVCLDPSCSSCVYRGSMMVLLLPWSVRVWGRWSTVCH